MINVTVIEPRCNQACNYGNPKLSKTRAHTPRARYMKPDYIQFANHVMHSQSSGSCHMQWDRVLQYYLEFQLLI